ncbi:MAG: anti-sigma factor RsbA family regulatory protein [Mycobacteriales bacterium]
MTHEPGPTRSPTPAQPSYRHEAFLYRGGAEFLAGLVPFVRDGIAAGEPVMVAVIEERAEPLREALGADAADVHFVDMAELGHNPARIIPGWQRFLDQHCQGSRPVRGIGEPVWAGRRGTELIEAQLHEGLLNVAVDPDTPLWLRCPYDTEALPPDVVEQVYRSHPLVVESDWYAGSPLYGGAQYVADFYARDMPEPSVPVEALPLVADVTGVRELVVRQAALAGLDPERVWAVGLAVQESAAAVARASGAGSLRVWVEPEALVCELRDPGPAPDPMAGRRRPGPSEPDERGLWLANQLCDLVQVRSTGTGSVVRITSWR